MQIIKLGNPLLRLNALAIQEEEFGTETLKKLAEDLINAMDLEKGIGLAAPQIGLSKRAMAFGLNKHPVHTELEPIPYTVLFNPQFEPLTDEIYDDYEGCLSVGALRGKVPRYKKIYYNGFDYEGNFIEREVSDLHARVFQHENDHLNGIIFLDKIQNHNSLGFHEELIAAGVFKVPERDK